MLASGMPKVLRGRRVGLEKESLRVAVDGSIAQTTHPTGLGSALTHPSITTDYSEALLELVTPPFEHFGETLQFLDDTHRYVYSQLDNEILWVTSMPCVVAGDASIPSRLIPESPIDGIVWLSEIRSRQVWHQVRAIKFGRSSLFCQGKCGGSDVKRAHGMLEYFSVWKRSRPSYYIGDANAAL